MKLEIKHLAMYLPYNPKFRLNHIGIFNLDSEFGNPPEVSMDLEIIEIIFGERLEAEFTTKSGYEFGLIGFDEVNIILRPLSDLTKEIEHNGEKFIPCDYWDEENHGIKYHDELVNMAKYNYCDGYLPYFIMNKLFEWHFDVFNLIKKDLAVDINKLTNK